MANVLVTGASGFVGANLVHSLLSKDHRVAVFTRNTARAWRLGDVLQKICVYPVDLIQKEDVVDAINHIRPSVVYHCATYGGYPYQTDSAMIMRTNILGSLHLFEALSRCDGLTKVVNIGSSSEYGQKPAPLRETDLPEPSTPYGTAKAAQTLLAFAMAKQGLPLVTFRLLSVYGPYEESGRLITDIMVALVTKKPLALSSPFPRRDFVFTEDVIEALLRAVASPHKNGEIYNIGCGRDWTIGDVVHIAQEVTDTPLSISWNVKEKERTFNTNAPWFADIKKSEKDLGWQPHHTLAQGLEKTYRWFQNNINLYEKT